MRILKKNMRRLIITILASGLIAIVFFPAKAQVMPDEYDSPSHHVDYRNMYVFGQQHWYHKITLSRESGKSYTERIGKYYTNFRKEMGSENIESGSYFDLAYTLLRRSNNIYWGPGIGISSGYYGSLSPAIYISGVTHFVDSWNAVQPFIGLNAGITYYSGRSIAEDFVVGHVYGYYNGYWQRLQHEESEDSETKVVHGIRPYLDFDIGITFTGIAKDYNKKIIIGGRASLKPYVYSNIELEEYRDKLNDFYDNYYYNDITRVVLPRSISEKMRINLGFYLAFVF